MDTDNDSGDFGSSSTSVSSHELSETEVNTACTAWYAAAGAATSGSRKFTAKQTAILSSEWNERRGRAVHVIHRECLH